MTKLELVDDWRKAWRWASVQLAAVLGAVVAALISGWPVVSWAINEVVPKGPWRVAVAVLGGVLTMGVPIATRLLKKKDC